MNISLQNAPHGAFCVFRGFFRAAFVSGLSSAKAQAGRMG